MLSNTEYITYEEAKSIVLSDNFTLDEFIFSDTALRHGIDNSMPRAYLPRIQHLVKTVLQPLRDKFGRIRVLSGYRSPLLCLYINPGPEMVNISKEDLEYMLENDRRTKSNHTAAFAADIEPMEKGVTNIDILNWIHENIEYKELIAEFFPHGWVHVAVQQDNYSKVLKLKDGVNNYKRVTIEQINDIYKKVA